MEFFNVKFCFIWQQDWFHDSSRIVLLICLNLLSVLKAEKNVVIAIFAIHTFAVQMRNGVKLVKMCI